LVEIGDQFGQILRAEASGHTEELSGERGSGDGGGGAGSGGAGHGSEGRTRIDKAHACPRILHHAAPLVQWFQRIS